MRGTRTTAIVAVAATAIGAWLCVAAPILPGRQTLPAEVYSLAGIDRLAVRVDANPVLLKHADFTPAIAAQKIERLLEQAGFEIARDLNAPTLRLQIPVQSSDAFPEAVSFTYQLTVEQNATLERTGRRTYVPTYTLLHGSLTSRDDLLEEMDGLLPVIISYFIERVRLATNTVGPSDR